MCYDTKRERPPEEPLDYSPSSGAVDSHEKEIEQIQSHPYPLTNNQTVIGQSDSGVVPLSSDDDRPVDLTWERLNELNRETNRLQEGDGDDESNDNEQITTSRKDDNRDRGRFNDIVSMIDSLERITEYEKQELQRVTLQLYQELRHERENGFQFGGEWPIEVPILALMTLSARRVMDIDTYDERDMDRGLHNVAFDGDQLQRLCEQFTPQDNNIHPNQIRSCRQKLRQ